MPLPKISALIRVNPAIPLEQSLADAFARELTHVLSGNSDHEGGDLETETEDDTEPGPPVEPPQTIPSRSDDLHERHPPGKAGADSWRRKTNRKWRKVQNPSTPRYSNSQKYQDLNPINVTFNANQLPAAKDSFVSRRQQCDTSGESTMEELLGRGFRVVEWDGR